MNLKTRCSILLLVVSIFLLGCSNVGNGRVISIHFENKYDQPIENITISYFKEEHQIGDIEPSDTQDYVIDLNNYQGETTVKMTYVLNNRLMEYTIVGYTDGSLFGKTNITINKNGEIKQKGFR